MKDRKVSVRFCIHKLYALCLREIYHEGGKIVQAGPMLFFKNVTSIYNEAVILSVLQRFLFFQDILISFTYRLTTGKNRPQKTWQDSTDFKAGENTGRKSELKRESERPFKNNPSFSFTGAKLP